MFNFLDCTPVCIKSDVTELGSESPSYILISQGLKSFLDLLHFLRLYMLQML